MRDKRQVQRRGEFRSLMRRFAHYNCTTGHDCHTLARTYISLLKDNDLADRAFDRATALEPDNALCVVDCRRRRQPACLLAVVHASQPFSPSVNPVGRVLPRHTTVLLLRAAAVGS